MKRFSVLTVTLITFMVWGMISCSAHAGTMDLITTLVNSLGITKDQARGGTGALFRDAKQRLSPKGFGWKRPADREKMLPEACQHLFRTSRLSAQDTSDQTRSGITCCMRLIVPQVV